MRDHTKIRAFEPADEVAGRSFSLTAYSLPPQADPPMAENNLANLVSDHALKP